jgi:parallel beta-helix repeat protein
MLEGNATATTSTYQTVLYQNGGLSHYNTITNNTLEGGSYGLYMRGSGTTSRGTGNNISNNSILNANYYQCYLYYQDSLNFNGNTIIQRPTSTSFCYGIYTYYCDDCNVTKNSVTLNTTSSNYGIMIGRWAGTQNELSNNMFVSSANATGTAYGIYDNYSLNVNIYHNSVNIRGGNPSSTRALYCSGSTSTLYGNIDIRNNIFANWSNKWVS